MRVELRIISYVFGSFALLNDAYLLVALWRMPQIAPLDYKSYQFLLILSPSQTGLSFVKTELAVLGRKGTNRTLTAEWKRCWN